MSQKFTTKKLKIADQDQLVAEITLLRKALADSRSDVKFYLRADIQLLWSFLRGALSALGAMAVVAILMPMIIALLHQISWTPLIDQTVSRVIHQLESTNHR